MDIQHYKDIFENYGGMMRTKDLEQEKIRYRNVQQLIEAGLVEKIRYGYYQWIRPDDFSEAGTVIRLFPDAILCMDTALRYYGYSDRTPGEWHLAVSKDSGKSRFNIDYPFVKPYYIEPTVLELGLTKGKRKFFIYRKTDMEIGYSARRKEMFHTQTDNVFGICQLGEWDTFNHNNVESYNKSIIDFSKPFPLWLPVLQELSNLFIVSKFTAPEDITNALDLIRLCRNHLVFITVLTPSINKTRKDLVEIKTNHFAVCQHHGF